MSAYIITRKNHIDHLAKSMPLIMLMFTAQIYIMKEAYPEEKLGNYSIFCALCICSYISSLFYYDSKIKTYILEDKLITHTFFGRKIEVNISQVEKVIAPEGDLAFSTIVVCLKDKVVPLRFIDNPMQVKNKIMQIKNKNYFSNVA